VVRREWKHDALQRVVRSFVESGDVGCDEGIEAVLTESVMLQDYDHIERLVVTDPLSSPIGVASLVPVASRGVRRLST